jgi:type IV fimbrial biogenesis protein FimT
LLDQEEGRIVLIPRAPSQGGFTLAELLVTVTIVALGATLAAPGAMTMIANRKVEGAAQSIIDGLNTARGEAVRRNRQVSFAINADHKGWTIQQVSPSETLQTHSSPEWGQMVLTTTPVGTVTFLPTGLRQSSGSQLAQVEVSSTVGEGRTRRINIFGGGLIRMCDPAATAADDPRKC